MISTGRGWSDQDRALLASWLTPDRGVQATTASLETATMVRPVDPAKAVARMVELRGVEAGFPLYGRVRLRGGQAVLACACWRTAARWCGRSC